MPPKRRPNPPVRTTSSKKRKVTSTSTPSCTKTSTRPSVTTPTSSSQAVSEDLLIQRIAVAVTQAFRDQTSSRASSDTPSPSLPAVAQHQPDSTPLVQQSVTEAIQRITGVNQETETSNDATTSKSQFVSVAAPLGSSASAKTKNKIWGNEFIDLGLLLNVQPPDESYSFKLQKSGGQQTLAIIPNQKKLWIYNIEQWTNAFLVFVAIYCEKSPSEAPSLMKYMSIVRDLASRSGNWRFYDESFRKLREVDPLPWGRTHSELWLRAHKVPKPGAPANFRPKQGVSSTPRGYCFKFHSGAQCGGCSFKHTCFKCGGSHVISRCSQSRPWQKSSKPNEPPNSTNSSNRS